MGSIPALGPVSRKSRELYGPEKPFVKLRPAFSGKLVFSYVVKGIKIKITAKFRASRLLRFQDTKRIMSPEIRPKSFGTFEKQAPGQREGKGKGIGHFYLTSVVPSVPTRLLSMKADGAPPTPPPCHSQCSVLRVFIAIATRIRGKSKQTLKSLKIESGTSRSESRALAN